ncbi:hypothetical protein J4526_06760 [Desulfurococcaceae archaeon MEX13E-LK6-19]|nr:hypothetical protein J4526_06760 [Desulfurococcaceae archaeon MEX13E-LK6-19]
MRENTYHRSRIDILLAILKFINNEGYAKKTHILYATNLNTRSLEKFLKYLVNINAVEIIEDNGVKYALTSHGRHILRLIVRLKTILNSRDYALKLGNEVFLNKLNSVLKDSAKDVLVESRNERIKGYSGLTYNVDILVGIKYKYVIIPVVNVVNNYCEEIDNAICKALLYLFDTDYKCIMLLSNANNNNWSHVLGSIKNLFNKIGIDEDRYFFVRVK